MIIRAVLICLMIALSVGSIYRYKADQCFEEGRRLLAKKELDEGFKYIAKAVKYNPFCLFYRNMLAVLLLHMAVNHKDVDLLGKSMEQAGLLMNAYPEYYSGFFIMGQAYQLLGKNEEAIKYYGEAIKRHPYKPDIRKKLASLFLVD